MERDHGAGYGAGAGHDWQFARGRSRSMTILVLLASICCYSGCQNQLSHANLSSRTNNRLYLDDGPLDATSTALLQGSAIDGNGEAKSELYGRCWYLP